MGVFHWQRRIRFRDCDPAGIVFYPRYFEMMNDCVETFFDEAIGWSFQKMHMDDGLGVPMGQISTRFEAPSRLGDTIDWQLHLRRVGGATADFTMLAMGRSEKTDTNSTSLRLRTDGTLVLVDIHAMKSRRWPDSIRSRLDHYLEESTA